MSTNEKQWDQAAEKIEPHEQGPLDRGDEAEPAHVEAAPLLPLTNPQVG